MGTLSNNSKVGDKGKDLILQTSSRVYVQVKDRFYEINFRGDDENSKEEEQEETPRVLFVEDSSILDDSYPYPGDDYLIIANGEFFRTINGEYQLIPISSQSTTNFSTPLTISTLEAPFNVSSNKLVKNLNAEYLNGLSFNVFAQKDQNEIISQWTIENLISNIIKSKDNLTSLNLNSGLLEIDTIKVKHLIAEETTNPNEEDNDESNSEFDIINKKTYFSNGVEIKNSIIVDKLESQVTTYNSEETQEITYFSNENYLVGGYSIIDLIVNAYNNDYIDEFSISEYVNKLTNCQKLNDSLNWETYLVTEEDFEENDGIYKYKTYKFTPKDSTIYESYQYGINSNCLEKIYNRWFDITKWQTEITKYSGFTYELEVGEHTLLPGDELSGIGTNGNIAGLVVGCIEKSIRFIITGTDCYYDNNITIDVYQEWDNFIPTEEPEVNIYETIKNCLQSQSEEQGKTISAIPVKGNILFTGSSGNIIGNISETENSIFGTLEGYGLTSEGNCYFVNPGIALVNDDKLNYLKLTNKEQSFIGINQTGENFITIENTGNCSIKRNNMYDINNYTSFCSFGPIVVQEDGSATIGTGETQITIDTNGVVKIPKAAILDI